MFSDKFAARWPVCTVLLLAFLLVAPVWSLSSNGQSSVAEVELPAAGVDFWRVAPFGQKGFAAYAKSFNKSGTRTVWRFVGYSNDMVEAWTRKIEIPKRQELVGHTESAERLYVLFRDNRKGHYSLHGLRVSDGDLMSTTGLLVGNSEIDALSAMNNQVYVAGEFKRHPYVAVIDMNTKRHRLETPGFGENLTLQGLQADVDQKSVHAMIRTCQARSCSVKLLQFDESGKKVKQERLPIGDADHRPTAGRFSSFSDGRDFVFGTWAGKGARDFSGIYIAGKKEDRQDYLKFHQFSSFTNFFKTKSDDSTSSEMVVIPTNTLSRNYRMLFHPAVEHEGHIVVVGEAYYPTFRTERHAESTANGQMITHTREVFDGYRVTHAVVAGFSGEGDLAWDHCFEIKGYKSNNLNHRLAVKKSGKGLRLSYASQNLILAQTISEGQMSLEQSKGKPLFDPKVNAPDAFELGAAHWYDNSWLAWGNRKVRPPETKGRNRTQTTVFVIERIDYSSE